MDKILHTVPPGEYIRFKEKRKKFLIVSHNNIYRKIKTGLTSDYSDAKNFDEELGTRLKDSKGRSYLIPSTQVVEVL